MEVFKTLVSFSDEDVGQMFLVDTIRYEGRWWLVGAWLASHTTGDRTPEWLACLSSLPHSEVAGQAHRFVLANSIPKAVLQGTGSPGYEVQRFPSLEGMKSPKSVQ